MLEHSSTFPVNPPTQNGSRWRAQPPRTIVVMGLSCDRGTPLATVRRAVDQALAELALDFRHVVALATVDEQHDEIAFMQLAQMKNLPMHAYATAQLSRLSICDPDAGRNPSPIRAIAESAALLCARGNRRDLLLDSVDIRGQDGRHACASVARVPLR